MACHFLLCPYKFWPRMSTFNHFDWSNVTCAIHVMTLYSKNICLILKKNLINMNLLKKP